MTISVRALVGTMRVTGWSWPVTLLSLALGTAVLVLLPFQFSPYIVDLAFRVVFYAALGSGLNMFTGLTGYVNFGYSAFVGAGAYALAISVREFGVAWHLALLIATAVGCLAALVVGIPLLRIRGIHFAIATVALVAALNIVSHTEFAEPLTHGATGIAVRSACL